MNDGFSRLTTREAAEILGCTHGEALILLRAAHVPHTRMGRRGPILWQWPSVTHLRQVLTKRTNGAGGTQ